MSFSEGSPSVIWSTNILEEKLFHFVYIGIAVGLSDDQRPREKFSDAERLFCQLNDVSFFWATVRRRLASMEFVLHKQNT